MPLRPTTPGSPSILRRYLLHFRWPNEFDLTTPIGVTAFSVDDAISIIREAHRLTNDPVPMRVDEDVDLSTIPTTFWKAPLGQPNWRGIWYPAYQLE